MFWKSSFKKFNWGLYSLLILVVGAGLRLYAIQNQLLLDDEWHTVQVVGQHDLDDVFHNYYLNATSIALNLYHRFVADHWGWNETWMRLPSLVCGLLFLILFYLFVKTVFGKRSAWIATVLASFSSFLIFYSRSSRPYSATVLCLALAVGSAYFSLSQERRRFWLGVFSFFSIFSIYLHLFAIPIVAACAGFLWFQAFFKKRMNKIDALWPILLGGLVVSLLYYYPVKYNLLGKLPTSGAKALHLPRLLDALELLSGTSYRILNATFGLLFCLGLIKQKKEKPLWFGLIGTIFFSLLVALFISKPESIHVPIVYLRYCIIFFPVYFIGIAQGIEFAWSRFLKWQKIMLPIQLRPVVGGVFAIAYFAATPLPRLLSERSNFMLHSAFQESYAQDWSKLYGTQFSWNAGITTDMVSKFYFDLRTRLDVTRVIEFPMPIPDHLNALYYYQHFHQKSVIAGFYVEGERETRGALDRLSQMLVPLVEANTDRFSHLINLTDPTAVERSGAQILIVHKNFHAEVKREAPVDALPLPLKVRENMQARYSKPIYEDQWLWVFQL